MSWREVHGKGWTLALHRYSIYIKYRTRYFHSRLSPTNLATHNWGGGKYYPGWERGECGGEYNCYQHHLVLPPVWNFPQDQGNGAPATSTTAPPIPAPPAPARFSIINSGASLGQEIHYQHGPPSSAPSPPRLPTLGSSCINIIVAQSLF